MDIKCVDRVIYKVLVKTRARRSEIVRIGENQLAVAVVEPAIEGKANGAVVVALAEYFGVSKSKVVIVSGFKSKVKKVIVES